MQKNAKNRVSKSDLSLDQIKAPETVHILSDQSLTARWYIKDIKKFLTLNFQSDASNIFYLRSKDF